MKNSSWQKARIVDCRLSKGTIKLYKAKAGNQIDIKCWLIFNNKIYINLDYDVKRKKIESSYDYYVHYEDFNRRMDEWVVAQRIIMVCAQIFFWICLIEYFLLNVNMLYSHIYLIINFNLYNRLIYWF
jgi:hypothetical protein